MHRPNEIRQERTHPAHRADAIIFDLDGTLLDTLQDLWTSVNHSLAAYSLPMRSMCEVRKFLGNGTRRLIHDCIASSGGDDEQLEASCYETFRKHYLRHSLDNTRPYEGVLPMLHQVKQLGIKTAIVSNKPDTAVQELYKRFFSEVIDVAIGERLPDVPRKPAPDMVFLALQQLGVTSTQAYYVGDSEVDFATSRAANLPCICVDWGFRDRQMLERLGAEYIVHMPEEIITIINHSL